MGVPQSAYEIRQSRHASTGAQGWLYGAQIGYNFQIKQLVLGVEADGSWGKLDTFIRDGNFLTENGKIDDSHRPRPYRICDRQFVAYATWVVLDAP
jgi:hypothetical protein